MANLSRYSAPSAIAIADARSSEPGVLVLQADGVLAHFEFDSETTSTLARLELPALPTNDSPSQWYPTPRFSIHVSKSGRFAAVVSDFTADGGEVIDLHTGRRTMSLKCGDYHADTVPFSACFLRFNNREWLVHRTEWNRLDISDPLTGELFSTRPSPEYLDGKRPPHYLDYFHGRLSASEDSHFIFDDGWVWQPFGVPYVFDALSWTSGNVWESEDAISDHHLPVRDDWNFGDCWIDDHRIALLVATELNEDLEQRGFDEVKIYDVVNPTAEPLTLQGVRGELYAHDGKLIAVDGASTAIWSIDDKTLIETIENFSPQLLIEKSGLLVELRGEHLVVADV